MKFFRGKVFRVILCYLVLSFLTQIFYPTAAWALTGGPVAPEFSSFEPVATTNMVNEFSGSFTYNLPVLNVPGPHGAGYPISLSYHSGMSPEEEASWVGFGWSLNPGAINRTVQGFPDDFDGSSGDKITYKNDVPANRTFSVGTSYGLEFLSNDLKYSHVGTGFVLTTRYNNYKGYGLSSNMHLSVADGLSSVSMNTSEEGSSFTAQINPASALEKKRSKTQKAAEKAAAAVFRNTSKSDMTSSGSRKMKLGKPSTGNLDRAMNDTYGLRSLAEEYRPYHVTEYSGTSIGFSFSLGVTFAAFNIGMESAAIGNYTVQKQKEQYDRSPFGYLYSSKAVTFDNKDAPREMDYSIEKQSTFAIRDKYLPIPFQTPDIFSVTGEGLGGTFRLYNSHTGHFYPTYLTSHTISGNVNAEYKTGGIRQGWGVGGGAGFHKLKIQQWPNRGNTADYDFNSSSPSDEPAFFRFNGDLGGNVLYSDNDNKEQVFLSGSGTTPKVNSSIYTHVNRKFTDTDLSERVGRSGYIGYNSFEQMNYSVSDVQGGDVYIKSYLKNNPNLKKEDGDSWDFIEDRTNSAIAKRIGEIVTYNAGGVKYLYGLPVFVRNQQSFSHGTKLSPSSRPDVKNNYLVYDGGTSYTTSETGQINDNPYPSTYLLTEITTPDYIDRTFDGPTADDFGGWTKFGYRRALGGLGAVSNEWYNFRAPYTGYLYKRDQICDPRYDNGFFSSGEKESYYLKTIETKTHVAFFVTNRTDVSYPHETLTTKHFLGSNTERTDGKGAALDAATNPHGIGTDEVEKLERIELYAKNANGQLVGKPLKVVHFEYYEEGLDYSQSKALAKGLPNSSHQYTMNLPAGLTSVKGGKLTLKRVWFEYEGVVKSKITPYEFQYEYKKAADFTSADLKEKYNAIINYGSGLNENPIFSQFNLDAWGDYCMDGAERKSKMRFWLDQSKPETSFDPAAWQLKGIKLPSGGEILVQYEQNEYKYVHDQPAQGMISLSDAAGAQGEKDESCSSSSCRTYYIKHEDADLDLNNDNIVQEAELNEYQKILNDYFISKKNRIYFKFLYSLEKKAAPALNECGGEFIDGYAMVDAVSVDEANSRIRLSLKQEKYSLPRQVCKDFLKKEKKGLVLNTNCDISREPIDMDILDKEMSLKSVTRFVSQMFRSQLNFRACPTISLENSYFRLPLLKAKKGGGVRVKRILMYDKGLEAGDEVLYGTEYMYVNESGESSGVASNEPSLIREENALIGFLDKRKPQKLIGKIVAGIDKEEFEGPNGESFLPPPSVGYSSVVVKNIHTGKTGTGFRVNKYFTYKDYPLSKYTEETKISKDRQLGFMWLLYLSYKLDNRSLTQGYRFVNHNMHGQVQSISVYRGDYELKKQFDTYSKVSGQVFEYYEPGEEIPVMKKDGTIAMGSLGKEVDVTMEMKSVDDVGHDPSIHFDFGINFFPPLLLFPDFSYFPYYSYSEKRLRSHVTTKVVTYPAIQKKVTSMEEGILHVTEHLAFSELSGEPVITTTSDGYDGLTPDPAKPEHNGTYTAYSIPAAIAYPNLDQMSRNQRMYKAFSSAVSLSSASGYSFTLTGDDLTLLKNKKLISGDFVRLGNSITNSNGLFYISSIDVATGTVKLQAHSRFTVPSGFDSFNELEVIMSGYNNMAGAKAGGLSTYGLYQAGETPLSPVLVTESGGIATVKQQSFGNNQVLSASATEFSDVWTGNTYIDHAYGLTQGPSDFELGKRGKWRLKSAYTYKTETKDGVTDPNRIFSEAGTFNTFTGFNYSDPSQNDGNSWLRGTLVTAYSPDGEALQEEDVLGIKSTARFGYGGNVPVLVAQNAAFEAVSFESFEDKPSHEVNPAFAHTGNYSKELGSGYAWIASVPSTSQLAEKGLQVKFWMKTLANADEDINKILSCRLLSSQNIDGTLKKVARVGEWTLYSVVFKGFYSEVPLEIKNISGEKVYLDDIRMKPSDASISCFVYDKTNLRLLASFDDQHFALLYQYDGEGKLVRKLVETERGKKTISETLYNTAR